MVFRFRQVIGDVRGGLASAHDDDGRVVDPLGVLGDGDRLRFDRHPLARQPGTEEDGIELPAFLLPTVCHEESPAPVTALKAPHLDAEPSVLLQVKARGKRLEVITELGATIELGEVSPGVTSELHSRKHENWVVYLVEVEMKSERGSPQQPRTE